MNVDNSTQTSYIPFSYAVVEIEHCTQLAAICNSKQPFNGNGFITRVLDGLLFIYNIKYYNRESQERNSTITAIWRAIKQITPDLPEIHDNFKVSAQFIDKQFRPLIPDVTMRLANRETGRLHTPLRAIAFTVGVCFEQPIRTVITLLGRLGLAVYAKVDPDKAALYQLRLNVNAYDLLRLPVGILARA